MENNLQRLAAKRFPKFGVNKNREIIRLVFEISKREKTSESAVLESLSETSYENVKTALLKRRYPGAFHKVLRNSFYLPKYETREDFKACISGGSFYPKNVYFTKDAADSPLFAKAASLFPEASFTEIESVKSFLKGKTFSARDYNNRTENLFIVREKYDFFKKCPCTANVFNCGYSIMNLGMGCPYECSYCFLQGYQNVPGIILPCNISQYLSEEKIIAGSKGFFDCKRIGSGEFTDSLVFDHITGYSKEIIPFFRKSGGIYFEFKTKSVNINNLLECGGSPNIVAAWSVNSKEKAAGNEHKAPDIAARLLAAKQCAEAGFGTAFHFDPIIPEGNWKKEYGETVEMIFDTVPESSVRWISLGTLRMPALLKPVIENRFPENGILDGELLLGKDYKLRYDDDLRVEVYRFMNEAVK
jgi:spore photoproduct lyase